MDSVVRNQPFLRLSARSSTHQARVAFKTGKVTGFGFSYELRRQYVVMRTSGAQVWERPDSSEAGSDYVGSNSA